MIYNILHYTVQYIQFCKYSKRILIGKIILFTIPKNQLNEIS